MSDKFHSEKRTFAIYAVYDLQEEVVFVGKTSSNNPRSRYTSHLRGEVKATQDDFGPKGQCRFPQFCVLEVLEETESIAYKHLLAWAEYFQEAGFALLNGRGTFLNTLYLYPETRRIYEAVCAPYTLDTVLSRKIEHPKEEKPVYSKQLNIRVMSDVSQRFHTFCSRFGGTQNEALDTLLHLYEASSEIQEVLSKTCVTLNNLKQTSNNQAEEIKILKHTLSQKDREISVRKNQEISVLRQVVEFLTDSLYDTYNTGVPLDRVSYKEALRTGMFGKFTYPSESGISIVTLDGLAYGKSGSKTIDSIKGYNNTPLFLFSHTDTGQHIKLRWFPRKEYIGIFPTSSKFAIQGSRWLIGYLVNTAQTNVDLILGIPLMQSSDADVAPVTTEEVKPKRSLDQQIESANYYQKNQ